VDPASRDVFRVFIGDPQPVTLKEETARLMTDTTGRAMIPQKTLHKSSNRQQCGNTKPPCHSDRFPTTVRGPRYITVHLPRVTMREPHGKTLPGEACWWTRVAWLVRVILRRGRKHALHVCVGAVYVSARAMSNFFAILRGETPLESLGAAWRDVALLLYIY